MAGINKAIIVGNLGADPEIRTLPNGDAVAVINVATSETWIDKKSGEKKENVQWHRIVFYRRQAEICGQYLKKGSKVYIEGSFHTRKWEDSTTKETKYAMEIRGNLLQMLDSKQAGDNASNIPSAPTESIISDEIDEGLPF